MCVPFSRNQYILLPYLNANLKYGSRAKGLLALLSMPAKELFTKNSKASPRMAKNRKVLGEKCIQASNIVNTLSQSRITRII